MRKSITLRTSALLSILSLGAFTFPASSQAGVITDLGTTTPTPGAADAYYLPTTGLTGSQIYDNNSSSPGPLQYGETFTTGSNLGGYTLSYVILEVAHNYSNGGGTLSIPFTIENSTQTAAIAPTESVTGISGNAGLQSDGGFNGHFIEYTFDTPVTLAANTQYSLVGGKSSGGGAVNFTGTGADGYAGGAAFTNKTDNSDPIGVSDLVFDAGLSATAAVVPEPKTWALMIGGLGILAIYQRRRASSL